jgi:hypothetical protein
MPNPYVNVLSGSFVGTISFESIEGLQAALDAKATLPIAIADTTGLQAALDAKATLPIAIADVTSLQAALDAKLESPIAIADTTGLQATLDAKLESPIAIADTTGLQGALDAKQEQLSDLAATGALSLRSGSAQMRQIVGLGGVIVDHQPVGPLEGAVGVSVDPDVLASSLATRIYDIFKANASAYPALNLLWGGEQRRLTSGPGFADGVFYSGVELMNSPSRDGTGQAIQTWTNAHPKGADFRYFVQAVGNSALKATLYGKTSTSISIRVSTITDDTATNATYQFMIWA